eukprot:scpid102289/ scgid18292/ 
MDGDCKVRCIVHKAIVQHTAGKQRREYLGLTEPTFKQRFNNHMSTAKHEMMKKSTELSKCIWKLKRKNTPHSVKWAVVTKAPAYSNATKRCPLCLAEKLEILEADKIVNINKKSELVLKCRHDNKYYLSKFSPSVTYVVFNMAPPVPGLTPWCFFSPSSRLLYSCATVAVALDDLVILGGPVIASILS